jgi:NAD+ synthase (glutamine-hydrolysing)
MSHHGFVRVAAAAPRLRVADCTYNAERILAMLGRAEEQGVAVLVLPELALTGYTCADLFQHLPLQRGAIEALLHVAREGGQVFSGLVALGLPLVIDDQVFNCAAVLHRGRILGIVPKSFIPNYKEFYEGRWFSPAATARSKCVRLDGQEIPFGTDLLFDAEDVEGLVVGVEICEDLWVPIPPSSWQAVAGAMVLLNLSASNEVIGKAAYRHQLVVNQSGRCMAAYAYASCGVWESTTDVVFGGHCMVAENGNLLAESPRLVREETLTAADVDLDRLRADRSRTNSFGDAQLYLGPSRSYRRLSYTTDGATVRGPKAGLMRRVDPHPFVPAASAELNDRCREIFRTQVMGLAKRLEHIGLPRPGMPVVIGISGGLDSTLALLVACKTFDELKLDRKGILGITMPGFGTDQLTRGNATDLMKHLGVTSRCVDIQQLCLEQMRAMGHRPFGIELADLDLESLQQALLEVPAEKCEDLVFENVQARMRTTILMASGFVVGTGDVSELALGWCTYNGDHMSMYNPNTSIPKTLVKFLVEWAAHNEFTGAARETLLSIVATKITPGLLPLGKDGQILQATEDVVGPYELHDFFLFHILRYGAGPDKVLFLAREAGFEKTYRPAVIRKWLQAFVRRFFQNQFKRSCLPDGPKVGSISLSPRGDWRMPSDGQASLWLRWVEECST